MNIHIICGPTASGKSARALEKARSANGIIINADSMQIYNALPLLTAQPSKQEIEDVPHTLYGTLEPTEKCSAARWRDLAIAEIEGAFAAGKTPIITGGTGFYIKALTEGLSPMPDVPDEIRQHFMMVQAEQGTIALHALLKERDPDSAAALRPTDTQRTVRALEVLEATGKSILHWQSLPKEGPPEGWNFKTEKIIPERSELHRRIERRFDMMVEMGALHEVAALEEDIATGKIPDTAPITQALGFRSLQAYLHKLSTREEAIEQSKIDTRQYAKRQVTWFRHQV